MEGEDEMSEENTRETSTGERVLRRPVRVLRRPEVEKMTALSRSAIYRMMKAGAFPKPVRLGIGAVAWVESEIDQWIRDRIDERDSYEDAS